jgi:hypothetical protein
MTSTAAPKTATPKTTAPKTAAPHTFDNPVTDLKQGTTAPETAEPHALDNPATGLKQGTTAPEAAEPHTFDDPVADLKQGTTAAKTAELPAVDSTVTEQKPSAAVTTAVPAEVIEKVAKTAKDFAAFNQGSLAAFTQASQTLATGSQDLFRQMVASSQAAFVEALSGFRALATAKTFKERLELQASLTRASAVWAVSEGSRFTQAGFDLAEKASAPLTARAVLAAETFSALKA